MEQTQDTGTGAGQDAPGQEGQDNAGTGAADGQQQAGGRTYTQQDLDAIAAKARRDAEKRANDLATRLAELEAAEAERKKAEMTEIDRAKAEAAEAKAAMEQARADAAKAQLVAERANILAAQGQGLPQAYQDMVTGQDADAIRVSLEEARGKFEADKRAIMASVATMTPEEAARLAETDETLKPLADRLAGRPVSIGAPSNAGATPPPPAGGWDDNDPATHTAENWAKERERRGYRKIR